MSSHEKPRKYSKKKDSVKRDPVAPSHNYWLRSTYEKITSLSGNYELPYFFPDAIKSREQLRREILDRKQNK